MKQNNNLNFDTESIPKLLLATSVPMIIAQLVNAFYNLVDRMYIGHMKEVGAIALTSIGITFPIIQAITAFSLLIGMGGGPLLSICLGQKDLKEARKLEGNSLLLLCVLGIILTVLFSTKAEYFLMLFGANKATLKYGIEYLQIYVIGTLPTMITMGMSPFLNAQGKTKLATWVIILGAVINAILDPIFIFSLDMGIKGAALATVISQTISALFLLYLLVDSNNIVKLRFRDINFELNRSIRTCSLGISSFAFIINESIYQVFMNLLIRRYAGYGNKGDLYIGAMTIICSLYQIFYMPLKGIVQGAQPLVGYYYGSSNQKKMMETIRYARYATVTFATVFSIAVVLFPKPCIAFFSSDPQLVNTSIIPLRLAFSLAFVFGFQMINQHMFIAVGEAKLSLLFAMMRKIFLLIPIALILAYFLGVQAIFFAEPLATLITMFATQYAFNKYFNLKKNSLCEKN